MPQCGYGLLVLGSAFVANRCLLCFSHDRTAARGRSLRPTCPRPRQRRNPSSSGVSRPIQTGSGASH